MKHTFSNLMYIIIGIIGVLSTFLFYDAMWHICVILLGIFFIFIGFSNIIYIYNGKMFKIEKLGNYWYHSIIYLLIGVLILIPWSKDIILLFISLAIGLYLIGSSVISLIKSTDKKEQFKHDMYKYLIGFLIIAFGISGAGKYICLVVFFICFMYGLINYIKEHNKKEKNDDNIENYELNYEIKDQEE